MKILQIAPQVPVPLNEGGRIGIYNIAKYLALRGHHIDFACYRKNYKNDESYPLLEEFTTPYLLDVDIPNTAIGAIRNLFSSIPYNVWKFRTPEMENFLHEYLTEEKPDVIHIDHLHMAWMYDVIRKYSDAPVILREHNVEMQIMKRFYEKQKNPLLKLYSWLQYRKFITYEPETCAQFEGVAAITAEDEAILLGMNKNIRTSVIPFGVDGTLLNSPLSDSVAPYSMFHIGSIRWLPNGDALSWFLQEILPLVLEKQPEARLFIYGAHSDKAEIPANVAHAVSAIGYVDDLWEAIKDKRIGVVPLRIGGGMRVKIVELMAAGKLIVSTSVGKEGIPLMDGVTGLVGDSPQEFAQKILDVFNGVVDEGAIIQNARDLIAEKYTCEKMAAAFEELYLKALAGRNSAKQ